MVVILKNWKLEREKKKKEEKAKAEQKPDLSNAVVRTGKEKKDRGVSEITSTHVYAHYPATQRIEGISGLSKAMIDLYGPNFAGNKHNPHFQNVRTGRVGRSHHCKSWAGEHRLRHDCFSSGHQLYCVEFVNRGLFRVRCGERIGTWSEGCGNPEHRTKLPGSMAKAMQELIEGDRYYIEWGQLTDPMLKELEHIEQAKVLTPIDEIEEQQVQQLEEYIAENDMDDVEDPAIFSTYKVWEDRKEHNKLQAKTQAALEKQLDEMTLAALASKNVDMTTEDPKAINKAWVDTRARLKVELASSNQAETDRPVNPRLAALEEKAANGGKAAKGKGAKANAGHRKLGIGPKQPRGKANAENQPPN